MADTWPEEVLNSFAVKLKKMCVEFKTGVAV